MAADTAAIGPLAAVIIDIFFFLAPKTTFFPWIMIGTWMETPTSSSCSGCREHQCLARINRNQRKKTKNRHKSLDFVR